MKQKNIQDFERESGRSSLIIGLVCIGFGIVLGAVVAKDTSVVSGVIIFIIMLAAGLFAMNFKKLERASRAKRADPTSSAYQKKQQRLEKAAYELTFAPEFDHIIVNDVLEVAQAETLAVVNAFLNAEDKEDEPLIVNC